MGTYGREEKEMSTTRTTEPTQITQGERVAWTKSIGDYPATLYTLVYRFRPQAGNGFNVTATADGDAYDAVITAAVSLAIPDAAIGQMAWQSWLTEIATPTNTFLHESGTVKVTKGFASDVLAAVDLRTPAKIALDNINAAISGQTSANIQEYEIATPAGSRKIKRLSMSDLLAAQKHYAAIVSQENARERAKKGKSLIKQASVVMYDN